MESGRVFEKERPQKRQKKNDTADAVLHHYSILQAYQSISGDKEKENIFIILPPELRRSFFELLVTKNEPEMFRLALSCVIDLLTPPEEIPGGAEGKDSVLGDLFFKHHKADFLEVLLDVFPDFVLAVNAELCLDLLESSVFQGHPSVLKCLLNSVQQRIGRYGERRSRQIKGRVAVYLREYRAASQDWLSLVGVWPESITFTTPNGNTLVHSLLQSGTPKQILRDILELRQSQSIFFHLCRSIRNNKKFLPYAWFFFGNLHRGTAFFKSKYSYNILHVLNYTSKAWVVPCEELGDLLRLVILETNFGTGPPLHILKSSLFIHRKSLEVDQWYQLLCTAASQPATCSPAPFSLLLNSWPFLSELVLKFWDPVSSEGALHLLIRMNNVRALRHFVRTSGLSFRLSDLLLNLEGSFFAPADPVVTAVKTGNFEVLRFLLTEGRADPNGLDRSRLVDVGVQDQTPLSAALDLPEPTSKRMVEFLLDHGANPNKNSSTGEPFLLRLIRDAAFSAAELQKLFQKHRFDFKVQSRTMENARFYNGFQAALEHRGVERVLFFLETVPEFTDFTPGQMHPFMFALRSLDRKSPCFMRHMLLLKRILCKKKVSAQDAGSSEWEDANVDRGLQTFMEFVPNHLTKFQVGSRIGTLSSHPMFDCRDIVDLIADYVVSNDGGPFYPLDLVAYSEIYQTSSSLRHVHKAKKRG